MGKNSVDKILKHVFCEMCKKSTVLEITDDDLKDMRGGLSSIMAIHRDAEPPHALLAFIDRTKTVRSLEYIENIQITSKTTTIIQTEEIKHGISFKLSSIISMFGKNTKDAINSFSNVVLAMISGYHLHITDGDQQVITEFYNNLKHIFTADNLSSNIIIGDSGSWKNVIEISLHKKKINKNLKYDVRYISNLIKEYISNDNVLMMRNEISKISSAYRKLMSLLLSISEKKLDTEVSSEIGIELPYMETILSMARINGEDVSNIRYDGISRIGTF